MRNGNFVFLVGIASYLFRSYPTYEEWKPFQGEWLQVTSQNLFLSYLWGMETPMFVFSQVVSSWVLILPMRNGNHSLTLSFSIYLSSSYPTYEEWKPSNFLKYVFLSFKFLSYLWGMETLCNRNESSFSPSRSYPTYEEWKPNFMLCSKVSKGTFLSYLWGMETC